jgi:hypothetical protein
MNFDLLADRVPGDAPPDAPLSEISPSLGR